MVTTNKNIDTTIFALKSQGMTAKRIAAQLNADGIKTARGLKWQTKNVANRLSSPKLKTGQSFKNETKTLKNSLINKVLTLSISKKEKLALLSDLI